MILKIIFEMSILYIIYNGSCIQLFKFVYIILETISLTKDYLSDTTLTVSLTRNCVNNTV